MGLKVDLRHTWPRVEIKGGDEFSKFFQTPGGGPRVGMIFNPRGGEGSDTNFLLRGVEGRYTY